jgi:predicted GIY-YIG superfamily endonuclease
MNPITIYPCIYVLKCEDDFYYVGITHNLNQRLAQHWDGTAAKWTQLHKPLEVVRVIYPATGGIQQETQITTEMMEQHGYEKVMGGSYCQRRKPSA